MGRVQGKVAEISDRLSGLFQRLVPLHPGQTRGQKPPSAKEIAAASERALSQFFEAARSERLSHGLGVFGRARVAFGLQQRLMKAGYPATLVKQVLFAMLAAAFVGDNKSGTGK